MNRQHPPVEQTQIGIPAKKFPILTPDLPKYAIWIAEDCAIYTRMARPNAWRRFWTWAFFGWRWTKVKPEVNENG